MQRVEYTIVTHASSEVVWALYSDWKRWKQFHPGYGDIHWSNGIPWAAGSRLKIEIVQPVSLVVEHLITHCTPPYRVGWIDHTHATTIEQWVEFQPIPRGGTRVHTWAELVGEELISGASARDLLLEFTRTWYDNFAEACDAAAGERS